MHRIELDKVSVNFPVLDHHRSFRRALVSKYTGGLISFDDGLKPVGVRALDGIDLKLTDGDRLGVVGHNGAGKSTLLRVLAGIYEPTSGALSISGRVFPLFTSYIGMDPEDNGFETIAKIGLFFGMTPQEIARKRDEIIEFSELGEFIFLPIRTYSTGMQMRLGFATATAIDPEILLLDEGLDSSDARFTLKIMRRLADLIERTSILVLVSHSEDLISRLCNKAILLDQGRIVNDGSVEPVLAEYRKRDNR